MAEFIDKIVVSDWEVETDSGWENIDGVGKTIQYEEWIVKTVDYELTCADLHILFKRIFYADGYPDDPLVEGVNYHVKNLNIGDEIWTKNGWQKICHIEKTGKFSNMYDLQLSHESNHRYYTNDILSHNSIFLGSLAYNMHLNGHNVLLVSLEMATYKILRRIGANAFDVPFKEYENLAGNPEKIGGLIKDFKAKCNTEVIPPGAFKLRRFGAATVDDIMALVFKLEEKYGIVIEGVVIDYFTELQNKYGLSSDDMYSYHKQNMNDMFNAGVEYNKAMITAHQVKVNGQNLNDMSLSSLSESSGIAFRPDNIFAIIQPPEMKQRREYVLKNIKSRDSEFKDYRTTFEIDYSKMRLTAKNDQLPPDNMFL